MRFKRELFELKMDKVYMVILFNEEDQRETLHIETIFSKHQLAREELQNKLPDDWVKFLIFMDGYYQEAWCPRESYNEHGNPDPDEYIYIKEIDFE